MNIFILGLLLSVIRPSSAASSWFAGTNWCGSGANGYNFATYTSNVVEIGGLPLLKTNVQNCANAIKSLNFNMVRIGWVHENVATDAAKNTFGEVIGWIHETGLNIMLVYGGVNGTFGDFTTLQKDWKWIDDNLGQFIWAYDILNEPYSVRDWVNWAPWAQYWVDWFRNTQHSGKGLVIEGASYASNFNNFIPLTDPYKNLLYEAHEYTWFHSFPKCMNCSLASNCNSYCDYNHWYSYFQSSWAHVYDVVGFGRFFVGEFGMGRNQGNQPDFPWIPIWYDALVNWIYWHIPGSNFVQFQVSPSDSSLSFSVMNTTFQAVHCAQLDLLYKPSGLLPRPPWY